MKLDQETIEWIESALEAVEYGEVIIIVHDGEIKGIEIGDRNLVAHSLRHTYNTIMKGILTAEMLREFTGHRSEEMTDRYDNPYLIDRLLEFSSSRKLLIGIFIIQKGKKSRRPEEFSRKMKKFSWKSNQSYV